MICQDVKTREHCVFLSCSHAQCHECLRQNVLTATTSHPFAPARCCGVIPTSVLLLALHGGDQSQSLTPAEVHAYCYKLEEMTSTQARLYCHDGHCAAYIPVRAHGLRSATCHACGDKTCRTCLQEEHPGVACSAEKIAEMAEANDTVMRLAAAQGWKSCPNCKNLVQKHGGCNELS